MDGHRSNIFTPTAPVGAKNYYKYYYDTKQLTGTCWLQVKRKDYLLPKIMYKEPWHLLALFILLDHCLKSHQMSQNHLEVLHPQTVDPFHLWHLQQILQPLSLLLFQNWCIHFHYNLGCLDKHPNKVLGWQRLNLSYLDFFSHLIHIFCSPCSVVRLVGNISNYNWTRFLDCSKHCICLNLTIFMIY